MERRFANPTKSLFAERRETPSALRSRTMRAVRSRDTAPEIAVRRQLRELGMTGYRLHRKDIPGKPDIAFVGRKKAIFVHGCFWHGHSCRRGARVPKKNRAYWEKKIARNVERDTEHQASLNKLGWEFLVVWECEIRDVDMLTNRLKQFNS